MVAVQRAPLHEIDRVRDAYITLIGEQYEAGRFVASGPKVPHTGGVMIAGDTPDHELDAVIAADPFTTAVVGAERVSEMHVAGPRFSVHLM